MRLRRAALGFLICLAAASGLRAAPPTRPIEGPEQVAGEVLVRFAPQVPQSRVTEIEKAHALTLLHEIPHLRVRHYRLPAGFSVERAVETLSRLPEIEYAEPNFLHRLQGIPSDPRFGEQWGLHNTGQVVNGQSGPADVDIDWPEAMNLYAPVASVIVAVIDSGVAFDHPELSPNVWVNDDPVNGLDDDGNGYVDDLIGWDFYDGDNVPLDENGHGTMVASLIGSAADNGIGGTGVAPQAKMMALRVLNDFGVGGAASLVNFLLSTTYATQNGARIINYSAGGGAFSQIERDQIAWLDTQGVLLIAAAGNGGTDQVGDNNDASPFYPASYDLFNILSVASTDRSDALAPFSNFGAYSVDLAAPGTDMFGADVKRSTAYLENFETGAPGWTAASNCPFGCDPWSLFLDVGGNTWANDSMNLFFGTPLIYQPFADTWVQSPWLTLPLVGPQLSFRTWFELAAFDLATVEVTTDGFTWQLVNAIQGPISLTIYPPWFVAGAGFVVPEDLSPWAGQTVKVRFRLLSDPIFQADGVYVDDVAISQVDVFSFDGSQFRFDNGTSFAAPLVSGVAALIWSQRPDFGHHDVRGILVQSVDRPPALEGKLLHSGRLNAGTAMQAVIAVPEPEEWVLQVAGVATLAVVYRLRRSYRSRAEVM